MSLALELKLLSFRCCGLEMIQILEIIGIEVPLIASPLAELCIQSILCQSI